MIAEAVAEIGNVSFNLVIVVGSVPEMAVSGAGCCRSSVELTRASCRDK
jgi:hypothetical protein